MFANESNDNLDKSRSIILNYVFFILSLRQRKLRDKELYNFYRHLLKLTPSG